MDSIYFHIPFCERKCRYCDFFSCAGQEELIEPYISALVKEIDRVAGKVHQRNKIGSIYFGGGTPSLIEPELVKLVMDRAGHTFDLADRAEITFEANPGTVSAETLAGYLSAGVNRLSMGVQSFLERDLEMLGRIHSVADVLRSVADARQAGFRNINLDLIYGLPGQTPDDWQYSLNNLVELAPEHISLYSLILEEETPLVIDIQKGLLPAPDPDFAADCYETAKDFLRHKGYEQYEIANWALAGKSNQDHQYRSRHNIQYWKALPYLGLGAGAHGYWDGKRYGNATNINGYIKIMESLDAESQVDFPAAVQIEQIDVSDQKSEVLFLGLRMTDEGVNAQEYQARFNSQLEQDFQPQIEKLIKQDLIEWRMEPARLCLTERGQLLGNRVFREFVR